jgi:Na+-transporting methylmalonyl-CoA/oxaloacetate decarboxylase gamma subunit
MSEKEVKVECTAEIMMRLQKSHVVVAATAAAVHTNRVAAAE